MITTKFFNVVSEFNRAIHDTFVDNILYASTSISFSGDVLVGGTITATVNTNSDGQKTFKSSDESVATVNSEGVVTGVKAGTAIITVNTAKTKSYAASTATASINVVTE